MKMNDMEYPTADATIQAMQDLAGQGAVTLVKWTCPKCGDRVTSGSPNVFNTKGYVHDERDDGSPCGAIYMGPSYGLLAIVFGDPAAMVKLIAEVNQTPRNGPCPHCGATMVTGALSGQPVSAWSPAGCLACGATGEKEGQPLTP